MQRFPLHVLVAEDDADLRRQLEITLTQLGATVATAADGLEALKILQERAADFELILTDVRMPNMDGLELMDRAQAHYDLPVAILTGHGDLHLATQALRAGAIDFIPKPVGRTELCDLLQRAARFHAKGAEIVANSGGGVCERLHVEMISDVKLVREIVRRVSHWYTPTFKRAHIPAPPIDWAITEALMNAVVHGNLEVSSDLKNEGDWSGYQELIDTRMADPSYGQRKVLLDLSLSIDQLLVTIEDQGQGFDVSDLPSLEDPDLMLASGRGIVMIRAAMDEVRWSEIGNRIEMQKSLR